MYYPAYPHFQTPLFLMKSTLIILLASVESGISFLAIFNIFILTLTCWFLGIWVLISLYSYVHPLEFLGCLYWCFLPDLERFLQIIFLPFSFWSPFSQCECVSILNGGCICLRPSSFILPSNCKIILVHFMFTCFVLFLLCFLFGNYTFELHNFDFFINTDFR